MLDQKEINGLSPIWDSACILKRCGFFVGDDVSSLQSYSQGALHEHEHDRIRIRIKNGFDGIS